MSASRLSRGAAAAAVALALACGGLSPTPDATSPAVAAARTEALAAAAREIDPCDPRDPVFSALSALNEAMVADPAAVDALLAEPELAAFAAHPVVARWRTSWQVDLDHPAGVALFLASHGDWWAEDVVPRTLRLEPDGAALLRRPGADDRISGTWALDGTRILLRMPDGEVSLKIRRAPYYLVLEGPDGAWAIDPVTCG